MADISRYVDEYLAASARVVTPGAREAARLKWFRCKHCGRSPDEHVGEQCLFDHSRYEPYRLLTVGEAFRSMTQEVDWRKL